MGSNDDLRLDRAQANSKFWEIAEDHRFALEVSQLSIQKQILKFVSRHARTSNGVEMVFGLYRDRAKYHLELLKKALVIERVENGYRITAIGTNYIENVEAMPRSYS